MAWRLGVVGALACFTRFVRYAAQFFPLARCGAQRVLVPAVFPVVVCLSTGAMMHEAERPRLRTGSGPPWRGAANSEQATSAGRPTPKLAGNDPTTAGVLISHDEEQTLLRSIAYVVVHQRLCAYGSAEDFLLASVT